MKIFIDTNVWINSVAARGLCADVVREVFVSHQLVVSVPLLTEIKDILRRMFDVPDELIDDLIELLQRDALFSTPCDITDIEIQDSDDVVILSSALNGNADLFITGDKELLELRRLKNMEILSPRMFWEKLRVKI